MSISQKVLLISLANSVLSFEDYLEEKLMNKLLLKDKNKYYT